MSLTVFTCRAKKKISFDTTTYQSLDWNPELWKFVVSCLISNDAGNMFSGQVRNMCLNQFPIASSLYSPIMFLMYLAYLIYRGVRQGKVPLQNVLFGKVITSWANQHNFIKTETKTKLWLPLPPPHQTKLNITNNRYSRMHMLNICSW